MRLAFLSSLGHSARYAPAGGGGTSSLEFSDDFNRADSATVGNGWTEVNQSDSMEISGNALRMFGGVDSPVVAQTGTTLSGVGQFAKVTSTVSDSANSYMGVMFRYTDSTSPHYGVYWSTASGGLGEWYRASNATNIAGLFASLVQDEPFGWASGDSVGITVMGTGTNVVVRMWLNPTGAQPDAGGTTWGSASPTVTMSEDPGTPVDTGNIVGLTANSNEGGDTIDFENFSAGTVT